MKKIYIIANWKSNKTESEVKEWFKTFNNLQLTINKEDKEIIICPPFTLLSKIKELSVNCQLSIAVGAQDISPFDEGAYTGEINGKQIKEYADYVLIGHSERKKYFAETQELLEKKAKIANKWNLKTIFCADSAESLIPEGVSIIVYEPPTSISPAPADTPENAEKIAKELRIKTSTEPILYGGNVTSDNVSSFTHMESISGVLVGRASLDASEFCKIIKNA